MHHHLPFLRGQTGEIGIQKGRKPLYMPAGISGMCVWKEAQGKGYQQKADFRARRSLLKTAVPRAQNYGYLKKPKKLDKAQEIEKTENLIKKNQLKKLRKTKFDR